MKLAYFPGCAATGTGRELNSSTLAACQAYGIELAEIPNWVCCGASAAHMTHPNLARALPAVSLAKAATMDVEGVLTACAACYNRLRLVELECKESDAARQEIEALADVKLEAVPPVRHIIEVFDPAQVAAKRSRAMSSLRVACYYGCLLTRPKEVSLDPNTVNPRVLDDLIRACGAETVEWPFKTECCGASLVLPQPESVARLSGRLLDAAQACGAEAIVVACPLCHSNLDLMQPTARRALATASPLPILYLTELVALALGAPESKLDLGRHTVPVPSLA
ncbi:MAG: CoB--CoM heterodisulfide reductase iron-sulfur subunit B family protein [Armatimonadetes bacterium]|nr:CoB--CoM heterodisulfide reductase iron-sulfur subunit B family protein [Armatimonadota bacterium]